jgi:hypothetical protein
MCQINIRTFEALKSPIFTDQHLMKVINIISKTDNAPNPQTLITLYDD